MTEVIDNMLVKSGFSAKELKRDNTRGWLYVANFVALGFATIAVGINFI